MLHNCNRRQAFLAARTRRLAVTRCWIAWSMLRAVLAGTAVRGVGLQLAIAEPARSDEAARGLATRHGHHGSRPCNGAACDDAENNHGESGLRAVPITEALQEPRKRSVDSTIRWWLDCLHRGYVFKSALGLEDHWQQWHKFLPTEVLFASYERYCRDVSYQTVIRTMEIPPRLSSKILNQFWTNAWVQTSHLSSYRGTTGADMRA
jgi:hypothetical protein